MNSKPLFIALEQLSMGCRNDRPFFRHNVYASEWVGVPILYGQANFSPTQEQEARLMGLLRQGKVYCKREDYYKFYSDAKMNDLEGLE